MAGLAERKDSVAESDKYLRGIFGPAFLPDAARAPYPAYKGRKRRALLKHYSNSNSPFLTRAESVR